jgi:hypothetical protein
MDLVHRYFWIAFLVVTVVNGRAWWNRAQIRIQSQPDLEPGYRRLYRGYLFWVNLPWLAMGLGILCGAVPSISDFLRPSEGNAFVLSWWGLIAAMLVLGTYWMFFGGGAETLERHPGVYGIPPWNASKLRMFWLGALAWNVAIFTLFWLGFPGVPPKQGQAPLQASWLWALFPVFFAIMWLVICFMLSAMGGWRALAVHYASTFPFPDTRFRFRSAQFGGFVSYGSCLTLGAGPSGLYLAILLPLRLGHPPLLISWADITAREARRWLCAYIDFEFAKAPGVSVRLSRRLAQNLFDASGTQPPIQPAAQTGEPRR